MPYEDVVAFVNAFTDPDILEEAVILSRSQLRIAEFAAPEALRALASTCRRNARCNTLEDYQQQEELLSSRYNNYLVQLGREWEEYEQTTETIHPFPGSVDISRTVHPKAVDSQLLLPPVAEGHTDSKGRVISTVTERRGKRRVLLRRSTFGPEEEVTEDEARETPMM